MLLSRHIMSIRTGRILKLQATTGTEIFVESTFGQIRERLRQHKKRYQEYLNGERDYCTLFKLFDKYGADNIKATIIKEYAVVADTAHDKRHISIFENLWCKKLHAINDNEPAAELLQRHKSRRNERITCDCGASMRYEHKSEHMKSARHKKYINRYCDESNVEFARNLIDEHTATYVEGSFQHRFMQTLDLLLQEHED
jgi:hypothetical protein